jgi:hypothetical protein
MNDYSVQSVMILMYEACSIVTVDVVKVTAVPPASETILDVLRQSGLAAVNSHSCTFGAAVN